MALNKLKEIDLFEELDFTWPESEQRRPVLSYKNVDPLKLLDELNKIIDYINGMKK
jgi:hypothetical protein